MEEQFLTKKLAEALQASTSLVARTGEGDRILISADRNPNTRGALVTGLIQDVPSARLTGLADAIERGTVKAVVSVGEDLLAAGLTAAQLAKVAVVYLGSHTNATSAAAKVVLPTQTIFEKAGTLVNQQFRLQKFARAVPGLAGTHDDLLVLSRLIAAVGGAPVASELHTLWAALTTEVPALATTTYRTLPETGLLLDATPWASLRFPEGETLHYKPAAAGEVAKV